MKDSENTFPSYTKPASNTFRRSFCSTSKLQFAITFPMLENKGSWFSNFRQMVEISLFKVSMRLSSIAFWP